MIEQKAEPDSSFEDVLALIKRRQVEFWRLLEGTGTDKERDEALKVFITEAWGLGYNRGVKRGGKHMADAIVERLSK